MATLPRELVLDIVKRAAGAIQTDPTKADDPAVVAQNLASACDAVGVSPEAFDATIADDPELELLKSAALHEAVAGGADPGPHAEISRESMSGIPGDLTKSRSEPEPAPRSHS